MDITTLFYKIKGIQNYDNFLSLASRSFKKNPYNNFINVTKDNFHIVYYNNKPFNVYILRFFHNDFIYIHRKNILRQVIDRTFDPSTFNSEISEMYKKAQNIGLELRVSGINIPKFT